MRLRWILLFLFVLDWACLAAFMWPLVRVSEVITTAEAWRFVREMLPVTAAGAVFQTVPWLKGRRW